MRAVTLLVFAVFLTAAVQPASAAIVPFSLQGNGGAGLLGANENPAVTGGGSGGEILAGISLDDVTNLLTINVGWGSANGFADLTGAASAMHIHDAGSSDLSMNGGVILGLSSLPVGFNASATNGGLQATLSLNATQVTSLMAGQLYLNVHTAANGGGEIRGNMQAVPEPSTLGLAGIAFVVGGFVRRRRK